MTVTIPIMVKNPAPAITSGIRFDTSDGSRLQVNHKLIGAKIPAKIAGNIEVGVPFNKIHSPNHPHAQAIWKHR